MHSIRTKITAMTVCAIAAAMAIATAFGVTAIRTIGSRSAERTLQLLCETGKESLDHYFESVERAVKAVSTYAETDLEGLASEELPEHLERVGEVFQKLAYKTLGALTYYYRIDPQVSSEKGFWFVSMDGMSFQSHEVTDISRYDTSDTSRLVWFTVPKATGEGVWLPPYITENLDVRVISYNDPIYYNGAFLGVIGVEIDYSVVAEEVNHIFLLKNGYAFLTDAEGNVVYHPRLDVLSEAEKIQVPLPAHEDDRFLRYKYGGVEKQAAWLPLENGMRLVVSVPVREINEDWQKWANTTILAFAGILLVFLLLILTFSGRITKPLRKLTEAAEQVDRGDYDIELHYDGRDEVGTLTRTFKKLTEDLKVYIRDLSDRAYADALTSLRNKGAFDLRVRELQAKLEEPDGSLKFAVCIFDCNGLKTINDVYGHDKGDIYLKESAQIICDVYEHSPVFRIGGDEFAALLLGRDFGNREELLRTFDERCADRSQFGSNPWDRVDVARGMAVYDPEEDKAVDDVVRRADKAMYENKWVRNRS